MLQVHQIEDLRPLCLKLEDALVKSRLADVLKFTQKAEKQEQNPGFQASILYGTID